MNEFEKALIRGDLYQMSEKELNVLFDMFENLVENEFFTGNQLEKDKIVFRLVQEEIRRRNIK